MAVLRTEKLTKDYPGCRALDSVTVSFESGKVNALLGKNGSGKSTLIKCFVGAIHPSSGKMYLDDKNISFSSPAEANAMGIVAVYQEMSLVPSLSVTENIFLGRMPRKGRIIDWKTAEKMARELLNRLQVDIDPNQIVSRLSMWQCQVVEILKAMSHNPQVLMLDEPTSALASHEVNKVFDVVRALKKEGVIIIYISHKLHEIPLIADTVTVLRDGLLIGKEDIEDLSNDDILRMMFGDMQLKDKPADSIAGDHIVMTVKGLTRKGKFDNISFELKNNEVLGIAGMLGSGRTELLKSIFGADPYDTGTITVNNNRVKRGASPITMKKMGLGMTPKTGKRKDWF